MLRLSLAQINPTVGDLAGNSRKIMDFVRLAKDRQSDIVAFPELCLCGYPPEDLLLKPHFITRNIKTLHALALKVKEITAVVGFVDRDEQARLYNAVAILNGGRIAGIYHKEELPNYGVFDEKRYFSPGQNNRIFALGYDDFAVNICEDIWVDGGVYQKQALQGAGLILNVSSSPFDIRKYHQRGKLLKRRAKETGSYTAYVNLVGGQDELVFDGGSMVVDPRGKMLATARRFDEDLISVDISLSRARDRRYKSFDIVKLDRVDHKDRAKIPQPRAPKLSLLDSVYQALVLGTRDYVYKNGFQKVVIGLSGGIDSALVAAIAVKALDPENVIGVTMPSRFTSKGTRADALKLAEKLGIECREIPIEEVFTAYQNLLQPHFEGLPENVTEENIQARIRGNILMALSNKFGWLVLTTGNKSEIAVGYCTLYGDMSGGFAVIKDLAKTQVYDL
ncbi:MAG: NAD+ synthase, partial [Candidatus Omnitrophica bacterium]|nr:NAD+ synthase [Candidatus Omnitrophota bacterium]